MGGRAGKIRLSVEAGGGGDEEPNDTPSKKTIDTEAAYQAVNQYFKQLQAEQLRALRKHHDEEIEAHEREINRHTESINRLKKRKNEISMAASSSSDVESFFR
ncbi:ATPase inhibitor, mitochondrial-like isoform X1 [Asterias rubens]|uniref:ATPase inhibitor, mitochondrial-like isoform X1 n=1 Tax=Asterias rubens TaxID=7604 RepID=UPI0014554E66|nr:ATPase inhibitor, mitochondrial-like isoform X1 [Asterias rubens]